MKQDRLGETIGSFTSNYLWFASVLLNQCSGSVRSVRSVMFLGPFICTVPDPAPDPDPPSTSKKTKENLYLYCFVTFFMTFYL
jgi:hypothetical protein